MEVPTDADEADQQVVLEELYDESYEPTDAEILEYAKWLGMDTDNEKELLWIARAGLREPAPEGWKPCQAPSKEIYYFNFITGESIWDHPCDEHFRRLYAQEKAKLQEQREQQLAEQTDQQQQVPQQQQQQQQQQTEQLGSHQAAGQAKAPPLVLPVDNTVHHTDVEPLHLPLTSPSGTLSTIASATTVSVAESPVGGRGQIAGSFQLHALQQQHQECAGDATIGAAMGGGLVIMQQQQPTAAAAATGARRSLTNSGSSYVATTAIAAGPDWRAAAAAADQEERLTFRQRLEEERHMWEQHLQADLHAQNTALQQQHQQRLWRLTQELQEQERMATTQLKAEQEARLAAVRLELQSTLSTLEQELHDARAVHAADMERLHSEQQEVEAQATNMLQQARQRLSATVLTATELSSARDKVAAAAELEALAEASSQRPKLLEAALQKVEQELSAEVAAYTKTRKAEALQQLTGQLGQDTATAAKQMEQLTADVKQLEALVAEKAAVLHKLDLELGAKQPPLHDAAGNSDLQALHSCREQLALLQQQLSDAQKQSAAADAALVSKRAAVAEAHEQLANVRREASVCEPRLSSLRQQLQEAETQIWNRRTELQQLQADVTLSNKRLQELQDEAARRQGQLDHMDRLYNERQESLRQTASELARQRGELTTLESSLSESLRRKADAEYQAVEEQLRRTRKAAADASAEAVSRQAALTDLTTQVAAKQVKLESLDVSLSAKSRELQHVLGQLQAAAAQEFQDAKKLLLEEEARLLESERRSMRLRVADQVQSERRAALAAGRRSIQRELGAQQSMQLSPGVQQQQHVQQWLDLAAAGSRSAGSTMTDGVPAAPAQHITGGTDCSLLTSSAPELLEMERDSPQPPASATAAQHQQQTTDAVPDAHDTAVPVPASVAQRPPVVSEVDSSPSSTLRRRARSQSPERNQGHSHTNMAAGAAAVAPVGAPMKVQAQPSAPVKGSSTQGPPRQITPAAQPLAGSTPTCSPDWQSAQSFGSMSAGVEAVAAALLAQLNALGAPGCDGSSGWLSGAHAGSASTASNVPQQDSQDTSRPQAAAYTNLLRHTKQFMRQRRRSIQQRQDAVIAAQSDWRVMLSAMEEQQQLQQQSGQSVPQELTQGMQQLRQLKGMLQDQIHQLNDETQQIKGLKPLVQQLKAGVQAMQLQAPQTAQVQATMSTVQSLPLSQMGVQQWQRQWQEQQQHSRQSAFSPAHQPALVPMQLLRHQHGTALAQASPIDKVSAALQAALQAATSWVDTPAHIRAGGNLAATMKEAEGPAASPAANSSRRSSLPAWPAGFISPAAPQPAGQLQQVAPGGSWNTLTRLREERGVVQQIMQQHSQWLQGFREQVAQVAAQQPAIAGKLQLHSRTASPAAFSKHTVAGINLQPMAGPDLGTSAPPNSGEVTDSGKHAAAGAASADSFMPMPAVSSCSMSAGQPLTVNLGGDQELVISVVHKPPVL